MNVNNALDSVWPAIVKVIGLNYRIDNIDKESGFIDTETINILAGFNNEKMYEIVKPLEGSRFYKWYGLRGNVQVIANQLPNNVTEINIAAHYEAYEDSKFFKWLVVQSNGVTEGKVISAIKKELASRDRLQSITK